MESRAGGSPLSGHMEGFRNVLICALTKEARAETREVGVPAEEQQLLELEHKDELK